MNDKQLGAVLADICEKDLLAGDDPLPADFEFSEEFEIKMRSIVISDPKPSIRGRLKAALVIAAVVASGFTLGMRNAPGWNYFVEKQDCGKNVSFNVSSVNDPKDAIREVYEVAVPKRFDFSFEYLSDCGITHVWNGKTNESVCFAQYTPSGYCDAQFSENARCCFGADGTQYYIDETEEGTAAMWYQDGYVFLVSGSLTKDEAMDMCKTLKISEKRSACLIQ